jgi:RNA polymerase sigma factor (sigma-70 family)
MTHTAELLRRWAGGDRAAADALIAEHTPWIEAHVRQRLGDRLRARVDTQDIVQNTLLNLLQVMPRFVCHDREHLRSLLARMVENAICAQAHHATAARRDVRREVPAGCAGDTGSVLLLDARPASVTQPGVAAENNEMRAWLRLALELLEPEDRNTVFWREFEGASFADVAARLGVAEDAARMRFARALPKLAKKLAALRRGALGAALDDAE